MDDLVQVVVKGVCIAETLGGALAPVVLLQDDEARVVPIFVGLTEAVSIHRALEGDVSPRPMTHDLFISTLETLNAKISSVIIDDLDGGIFYARLTIKNDSMVHEIDARPSDCMALAVRTGASIHMHRKVLSESCVDKADLGDLKELIDFI